MVSRLSGKSVYQSGIISSDSEPHSTRDSSPSHGRCGNQDAECLQLLGQTQQLGAEGHTALHVRPRGPRNGRYKHSGFHVPFGDKFQEHIFYFNKNSS